ncbi:ATP-binding protein [Kitasatospora sp. HPMI-4]|uniref:ATP-binding protein n=1 Tax=Kitasatospora sp. HPMI-4 TaxID=3448443 RepID=UPI003F1C18D0
MPLPQAEPEDAIIDEACRELKLPTIRARLVELATTARREGFSYKQFLADLLQVECADRDVRRKQRLVRAARFPQSKRLEDFESDKSPNVTPEFGYLNLDKKGAKLLFQISTKREQRKATAVASNALFSEWDKPFTDPRLCAAIADRLTFKGTLIQTGTDSYRLKATEAERQTNRRR